MCILCLAVCESKYYKTFKKSKTLLDLSILNMGTQLVVKTSDRNLRIISGETAKDFIFSKERAKIL